MVGLSIFSWYSATAFFHQLSHFPHFVFCDLIIQLTPQIIMNNQVFCIMCFMAQITPHERFYSQCQVLSIGILGMVSGATAEE